MTVAFFFFPLVCVAAFIMSTLLTWVAWRILLRRAVMDLPNERSMHTTPVPRGGGLAVMLVIGIGLVVAFTTSLLNPPFLWVMLAVALLMGVSWIDDRFNLNAAVRLGAHFAAALLGSFALPHEAFLTNGFLPFWLDRLFLIVGWAWFVNLYNFMDGIDGITGIETICLAAGAGIIFACIAFDDAFAFTLIALLVGACLGFLVFNWHPAKIFLGDVGSVPLGFLTGFLLLQLAAQDYRTAAFILPLYYIADSGITISRRILRREKFWQPHRQHFYQRAAQGLGRHDRVVGWILATNVLLLVTALLATSIPTAGLGLAVVCVALLLFRMHKSAPP